MERFNFSLETIEVSKIKPNPNNPRGPRVRDNDDQFDYLKRSIKEFDLLVPLVIQEIIEDKEYILIDGERRYYVLKELGIKLTPAHVIKGTIAVSYTHLRAHETRHDLVCRLLLEIATELVKLTGTNKRTINDRLNFLRWPEKIKNMVYNEKPDLYWTVAEIEGGIIKPAEKNFPEYFEKVLKDEVREYLLRKYIEGIVHASTEVRKAGCIVRTPKENIEQHEYASKIFEKLVKEINYTFEEAQEEFLSKYPEAEKMMKTSYTKLRNQLLKVITILKDYDISLLFKTVTDKEKEEFREILQELERTLEDFKQDSQDLF